MSSPVTSALAAGGVQAPQIQYPDPSAPYQKAIALKERQELARNVLRNEEGRRASEHQQAMQKAREKQKEKASGKR